MTDDERATRRFNRVVKFDDVLRKLNGAKQSFVGRAVLPQTARFQHNKQTSRRQRHGVDVERIRRRFGRQPPVVSVIVGRHLMDTVMLLG